MCDKRTVLKNIEKREELKRRIEELEDMLTQTEDYIKSYMVSVGKEEERIAGYKVSYKMVSQNKFDSKAFHLANPALYESFKKPVSYMRLLVH